VEKKYPLKKEILVKMINLKIEAEEESNMAHELIKFIKSQIAEQTDRPEVFLPPQKRLCFAFGPRYEVGESSSALATRPTRGFRADYNFIATLDREIRRDSEREVGYGITNTWDEMLEDMPGAPATDETELGRRMTNFV
ncbi:hypothetical protein Tco_0055371, partial [Tanacetum coccineum]